MLFGCHCSQASSVVRGRKYVWVYVSVCVNTNIFTSLTINRYKYRPIFKYVHLYLCILKTMSSPQCLQFQSNPTGSFSVSFFSIFVNSSSYSENLVPWSLPPHSWIPRPPHYCHCCGQTQGRYLLTHWLWSVALDCCPHSHGAAALLSPT